jgi:hypothetical protein
MMKQAHIPHRSRHLPSDLYGHFDIQATPDGGKRYTLPHTIRESALAFASRRHIFVPIVVLALLWPIAFPEREAGSPLTNYWLHAALAFALAHGVATTVTALVLKVSGLRQVTRITIRPDGLILDDVHFFAADHIWAVGYGDTENEGKADERFTPEITIQVGTNKLILATGVEVEAGRLFMRLFSEDTRHYWSRHN